MNFIYFLWTSIKVNELNQKPLLNLLTLEYWSLGNRIWILLTL